LEKLSFIHTRTRIWIPISYSYPNSSSSSSSSSSSVFSSHFLIFQTLFFPVAVAESREDTGDDTAQERSYHERLREATDMPDLQPQQPAASIPLRIEVGRRTNY
jgi:hypothetical protein